MASDAGRSAAQLAGVNPDAHQDSGLAWTLGLSGPGLASGAISASSYARRTSRAVWAQLNCRARSRPRVRTLARNAESPTNACHRVSQTLGIVRVDQEAGVADHFGQRAAVRSDDRHARRHRFESGQAEAFLERRQHEQLRSLEEAFTPIGGHITEILDVAGKWRLSRCARAISSHRRPARPAMTRRGASLARATTAGRTRPEGRRDSFARRACPETGCSHQRQRSRAAFSTQVRRQDRSRFSRTATFSRRCTSPAANLDDTMIRSARRAWSAASAG